MKVARTFQPQPSLAAAFALAMIAFFPGTARAATTEKFTSSTTWTCPAGVTAVTVEVWGGGGAGGGASKGAAGGTCGGGGGGGGAYAKKVDVPVTPDTIYTITIPAPATCTSGFTHGQTFNGASVTFTGDSETRVTANGGTGGACVVTTSGTASVSGAGGMGGAAGAGLDAAFAGGNGATHTSGNAGAGGSGASDLGDGNNGASATAGATKTGSDVDHNGGTGATGKTGAGNGNTGAAQPGGAGGGAKASVSSTSFNGSAGGRGQIILTYTAAAVPTVKANNQLPLNDPSSWTDHVPTATEVAKWDNTVLAANTTDPGEDLIFGGIAILNPLGPVTVNAGNTVTVGSELIDLDLSAATADLTLNCDLALSASNVWDVPAGRILALGGIVSGGATVTKQGDGKAVFSGPNTYSGSTTVSAGTVQLGANDVMPNGSGKGNLAVAAASTFDLNSFSDALNGLSGAGIVDNTAAGTESTLSVGGNNATTTFSGVIRNSGAGSTTHLVKTGSGQFTLSGANTFTGSVTVTGGNLTLGISNPLPNISGLSIGGAQIGCSAGNAVISAPVTLTGNLTVFVQNSGVLTSLNGAIGGSGNLTFATDNNTLNGNNRVRIGSAGDFAGNVLITTVTTTGQTTLNNMTVQLGADNALPPTAVVTIDGQNGNGISWADLDLNGFNQTLAGLASVARTSRLQRVYNSGVDPVTLTVNNAANRSFGGTLGKAGADNFALAKGGSGTFTLSGANTYTGTTTVTGGTLALGASNVLPGTAVSIGGATLSVGAGFTDAAGTLALTGSSTIHLGDAATALVFADSSGEAWTGTLDLTGVFDSGASLRFGDGTGTGLTGTQLASISANGFTGFSLDDAGFLTATATGGYSSWQSANGTAQTIELDHDGDGVSNGIEYFLGGNAITTGFTGLPGVTGNSVTWIRGAGYSGTYGVDFVVETSTSLTGVWTPADPGSGAGQADFATVPGEVKFTFPAGPRNFARLKVTGP